MQRPLYQAIASHVDARKRCAETDNEEWYEKHGKILQQYMAMLPSGSGIDRGPFLCYDESSANKLVFSLSYHHMEEGMYVAWTDHIIRVRPSLVLGFNLTISGPNYNNIKDYLGEVFSMALEEMVT